MTVKSSQHYRDQAADLRRLAEESSTQSLRATCIRAAEGCEALANKMANEEAKTNGDSK